MTIANLMQRAGEARRAGRNADARALLEEVIGTHPHHAAALNLLGLIALSEGDAPQALRFFQRAAAADPAAPPVWLNLAEAQRAAGDVAAELISLDRALAIDPYLLPALLRKAQALERAGSMEESAEVYRAIFATTPADADVPEPIRVALAHAGR